jgi:hypothetical protein
MPKDTAAGSSEGGLVYLKYTFKYRSQFDEPNDDWLNAIDTTSDELLGSYSRAEDDAMTTAFGGQGEKRLNRVFDVIGFVYPDYCYPTQRQGKKRKTATSVTSSTSKSKKIKVPTHWPRHIETAKVPNLIEGSSCASEPHRPGPIEARAMSAEEPKSKKSIEQPNALSPLQRMELPKASNIPATTLKRRMASVLDIVMESTKALTLASAVAPSVESEIIKKSTEAGTARATVEAGPLVPAEARPLEAVEEGGEARPSKVVEVSLMLGKEGAMEESEPPAPRASTEELEFIVCHALGKNYRRNKLSKHNITPGICSTLEGPWCMVGMTKMTSFIVCLTIKRFLSIGRWQTM